MPKDERYLELYSKPVLATLSGTELKFIATYHHYEVEDDYDDNPRYYFYEIGPYPPICDDSMLIYDTDISHMTLFDPETMGIERVEYDDMTEREQWMAELLWKEGYVFTRKVFPGRSNVRSGYGRPEDLRITLIDRSWI